MAISFSDLDDLASAIGYPGNSSDLRNDAIKLGRFLRAYFALQHRRGALPTPASLKKAEMENESKIKALFERTGQAA